MSPPLPRPWSHLLETGLDKVGLVDEPLLEVIEALVLEAHGLPACQLLSWWELCQERGQVVQLRLHLPQVLLMHHTLLWGWGSGQLDQQGLQRPPSQLCIKALLHKTRTQIQIPVSAPLGMRLQRGPLCCLLYLWLLITANSVSYMNLCLHLSLSIYLMLSRCLLSKW